MSLVQIPTKGRLPLYQKVEKKDEKKPQIEVQVPIISTKSLVLQGLILASAISIADAISETANVFVPMKEKQVGIKYIYAGTLVAGTYYLASNILFPEKYKI